MTSIEWLFEEYKLVGMLTTAMVDKAQEMHNQEIMSARQDGFNQFYLREYETTKEHYQETFKKL